MTHSVGQRRTGNAVKSRIEVSVLGGFEVHVDGSPVVFSAMASRLIAYLAIHRRTVERATIAGILWPESTQARAQGSLRTTLWRVRTVHDEVVRAGKDCVRLAEGVAVDADTLIATALKMGGDPGVPVDPNVPISWFSCELLPCWYDDWIVPQREHFRLMALHTLEWSSAWYVANDDYACAAEYALAAVHLAPLRESSRRVLMRAHLANGNVTEAIGQYQQYRDLLRTELNVEPSAQMRLLLDEIQATSVTNVA